MSGKVRDDYIDCLKKDKKEPGLRLWIQRREGDYFIIGGFWVGADPNVLEGKDDAPTSFDSVKLIGEPEVWRRDQIQEFAAKPEGNKGFFLNMKVGGQTKSLVVVPDPPDVAWLKETVVSPKKLSAASTYSNPCTGTSDSDTIYPRHPGGYFVPGTRTVNRTTTDAGHYGERFTVDRPDQVSVTISQSTGACELRQFATGQLQAVETYPQAVQ